MAVAIGSPVSTGMGASCPSGVGGVDDKVGAEGRATFGTLLPVVAAVG
jgi:hypothetical protein